MLEVKKYYVCFHYESGTLLHREGCKLLPKSPQSRIFIGSLYTPKQAMTVAVVHQRTTERCPVCLKTQNPARKERLDNLSQKLVVALKKRSAPKAKKAPAITTQKYPPADTPIVRPAAALMKHAIAQQQIGPQQVVKIKSGLEVVPVQHFVYEWPN